MNFFLALYQDLKKMGMDCKDLDSLLNAIPWNEQIDEKGNKTYVYEIKEK